MQLPMHLCSAFVQCICSCALTTWAHIMHGAHMQQLLVSSSRLHVFIGINLMAKRFKTDDFLCPLCHTHHKSDSMIWKARCRHCDRSICWNCKVQDDWCCCDCELGWPTSTLAEFYISDKVPKYDLDFNRFWEKSDLKLTPLK